MSRGVETELPQARYSYGGDEFVFVELAEAMSLKVNFRAMAITNKLEEERIDGVMDICPSNASYMVRIDPDVLHLGMKVRLVADMGAYLQLLTPGVAIFGSFTYPGLYAFDAYSFECTGVFTNLTPTAAPGAPKRPTPTSASWTPSPVNSTWTRRNYA
jgi:CO/xanthine dehydrogenase Mo-binding subunit